jgi:hypothetical protein
LRRTLEQDMLRIPALVSVATSTERKGDEPPKPGGEPTQLSMF